MDMVHLHSLLDTGEYRPSDRTANPGSQSWIAVTHQSLFTVQLVIELLVLRLLNQTVHSRWHRKVFN